MLIGIGDWSLMVVADAEADNKGEEDEFEPPDETDSDSCFAAFVKPDESGFKSPVVSVSTCGGIMDGGGLNFAVAGEMRTSEYVRKGDFETIEILTWSR